MFKKIIALFICLFVSTAAFAFDCDKFYKALDTYSKLANRSDALLLEAKETWKFDEYERAMDRSDAAARLVFKIISRIRKAKDIETAQAVVAKFEKEPQSNQTVVREAKKALKDQTSYLSAHSSILDWFKKK